ncbi:hypothetical protein EDF58_10872 [Novosphingobium sp. PhB57]|uniref:hypothetical protein n=1 Tax=Novosphingobium sp. PhB57 TaxID=2485107 RepID=UPI0010CE82C9|nr:hypothetical protein [Novosphingobium sp. PhB57]TCU54641.1 hypothetical protein EDF58_10872 [Novosphingobium sp. PhB57]
MPLDEVKTRILVVEDKTLIRMVGAEILEDAGFDVLEAADADEAQSPPLAFSGLLPVRLK